MRPFCRRKPDSSQRILAALGQMRRDMTAYGKLIGELMAAQDDINAATQAFQGVLTDLQAQAATLVTDLAEIQAAVAAGQPVDTSALNAVVANAQAVQSALDTAVANIDAEAASVTPPAPQP